MLYPGSRIFFLKVKLFKGNHGNPSLHQPFTGCCTKAETGKCPEWIGLASVPWAWRAKRWSLIQDKRMTDPWHWEWITEAFPTCMIEALKILKTDSGWLGIHNGWNKREWIGLVQCRVSSSLSCVSSKKRVSFVGLDNAQCNIPICRVAIVFSCKNSSLRASRLKLISNMFFV